MNLSFSSVHASLAGSGFHVPDLPETLRALAAGAGVLLAAAAAVIRP